MTARVRKARHSSRAACGCWVNMGNLIVSRNHAPWICLDCRSRLDPL